MMDSFFKQGDDSVVKDALLSQLAIAVKEVQADFKSVESSSDTSASFLSTVLEAIFIHGLKETLVNKMSQVIVTDFGQRPDPNFWAPLLIFSHRDVIHQIGSLTQVTTDVGRGRAWLRLALNESLLSSYLYSMAADNSSLKPYYSNNAFLRDSEKLDLAKQLIEGIETCSFSFVCNSSLLNIWTNMPLLMAGISTAPLRSCPISSGTDVAQTLTFEEETFNSTELNEGEAEGVTRTLIFSFRDINVEKISKSVVDEEEAFKIILGTPVNESPLQIKLNNEQLGYEERAVDLPSTDPQENVDELTSTDVVTSTPEIVDEYNLTQQLNTCDYETKPDLYKTTTTSKSDYKMRVTLVEDLLSETNCNLKSASVSNVSVLSLQQSYQSLLKSYNNDALFNGKSLNIKDVVDQFEQSANHEENIEVHSPSAIFSLQQSGASPDMISSTNSGCDFEVVPISSSAICYSIPECSSLIQHLTILAREQGLDAQNYSCAYCKNPIGVNLEIVRVCGFTGDYYCKECYGYPEEEWIIPARVLHNWDFRRYSVSERSERFLLEIQHHPLLDMKAINPRLYVIAEEMSILQNLRMQLNLLRAYLFTCHQPIGEDLKKQIWPKEYLYEHLHLYSVSDLMKISNGTLIQILQKAVSFSRVHVLSCSLCKQKGFICEICSTQAIIYPFDLDSTYKCCLCSAVYHSECFNHDKPCPKCERQERRRKQDQE